jgi:hypothetical protein
MPVRFPQSILVHAPQRVATRGGTSGYFFTPQAFWRLRTALHPQNLRNKTGVNHLA